MQGAGEDAVSVGVEEHQGPHVDEEREAVARPAVQVVRCAEDEFTDPVVVGQGRCGPRWCGRALLEGTAQACADVVQESGQGVRPVLGLVVRGCGVGHVCVS